MQKLKKTIVLSCFLCLIQITNAQDWDNYKKIALIGFNSPFGYQQGFGFNTPISRPTFDANVTFAFINASYSYQKQFLSSVYWGIGLGSIIQIQFGREKLANTKLFRIRTDFPLYVFDVDEESILNTMSAGLFYDHAFNNPKRASTIGISIGFSMVSLLMSED